MKFLLKPGQLTIEDIRLLLDEKQKIFLDETCHSHIAASLNTVTEALTLGDDIYGINTGFGALARTRIADTDLAKLQQKLVLSHAAGTGELFSNQTVRLILALKINSLARGYSGVRLALIDALIRLFNKHIYPCIPCKGSVGASGDLAPLAHMSCVLIGVGEVSYEGRTLSAKEGLKIAGLEPLTLAPKEGLALLNGTQVSTALALLGLLATENNFRAAIKAGALSVEAMLGSYKPYDERIAKVRGHTSHIAVAKMLRELLTDSEIHASHQNCDKVQDPYSLRCQPQVMGACLSHLLFVKETLLTEANGVSDNPIIFARENEILSGGNFHGQAVAMAADTLALSIAEIGALSERRIALLTDTHFSHLPAFLVDDAGINSGFMVAQVTASALASENKFLAHPASVDSIPTSDKGFNGSNIRGKVSIFIVKSYLLSNE